MTVGELAALVEGNVVGDADLEVTALAPVFQAGKGEMGLLGSLKYLGHVEESDADALLISADLVPDIEPDRFRALLVVERAHAALPTLLGALHPPHRPPVEIHPTAVLGRGVMLGEGVSIGPYAVLGEGVKVGDRTRISPHVTVGRDAVIGEDCVIHPQVVLYANTRMGDRVIIHSGTCLGADGFGYYPTPSGHEKVPQVGDCVIEADVEIGANCCVDRGSIGRTVVGAGTKIDNLVQVAHNVMIGERTLLVAQVGIAGSTRVGRDVVLGGQAAIAGHLTIGDGARIGGGSGLRTDLPAGEDWFGYPAIEAKRYFKALSVFYRLPELLKRVRKLERERE